MIAALWVVLFVVAVTVVVNGLSCRAAHLRLNDLEALMKYYERRVEAIPSVVAEAEDMVIHRHLAESPHLSVDAVRGVLREELRRVSIMIADAPKQLSSNSEQRAWFGTLAVRQEFAWRGEMWRKVSRTFAQTTGRGSGNVQEEVKADEEMTLA